MAIPFLNNINLDDNQLLNAKVHVTSSAPTAAKGQIYLDSTTGINKLKYYDGSTWVVADATVSASFNTSSNVITFTTSSGGTYTVDISDLETSFTIAGDTGTEIVSNNDTLTAAGGTYITTAVTETDTLTISHDDTSRTDTTSTDAPAYSGTFEAVTSVTTNATGHVTGIDVSTITIPDIYSWNISDGTTSQSIEDGNTLSVVSTDEIETTISAVDTFTIGHADVTRTDTTSTESPAHEGTFTVIDSITSNARGHITAANVKTITLPVDNDTTYDLTNASVTSGARITLAGSDSTSDTFDILGSTNITATHSAGQVTLSLPSTITGDHTLDGNFTITGDLIMQGSIDQYNTTELLVADQYITLLSGQTEPALDAFIKVERGTTDVALKWDETNDRWSFTNDGTTYYNIPVPSEYDNFAFSVAVGATTQEVSNGGTVTFVQGGGLTVGISADDTITYSHADTSSQNSVDNSGLNVIQDIALDTYGHITSIGSSDITSGVQALIDATAASNGYAATITDSVSGTTFNHGLGEDVIVQLFDTVTKETVYADVVRNGNYLNITFASTPTNSIRVLVQKIL
jgi:hypothetical protein